MEEPEVTTEGVVESTDSPQQREGALKGGSSALASSSKRKKRASFRVVHIKGPKLGSTPSLVLPISAPAPAGGSSAQADMAGFNEQAGQKDPAAIQAKFDEKLERRTKEREKKEREEHEQAMLQEICDQADAGRQAKNARDEIEGRRRVLKKLKHRRAIMSSRG